MKNKEIFFTFDMDWASDEVLDFFLELLEKCDIKATIHVTHDCACLKKINRERIDLGVHPNFNQCLNGEKRTSVKEVLDNIFRIVPDAKCIRCHALTSSSIIGKFYDDYGIKYDLNTFLPVEPGNIITTYDSHLGNYKVIPFIFEDDIYLQSKSKPVEYFLSDEFYAPRVFNFHPIHLFLNTDSMKTYEMSRPYFFDYDKLRLMRNNTHFGIRDFFIELVEISQKRGWQSKFIKEGLFR